MPTDGSRPSRTAARRREPCDGAVAAARHRRAEAERRRPDAGQRADPLEQLARRTAARGSRRSRARQVDADGEQPRRVDPDAGLAQPLGAAGSSAPRRRAGSAPARSAPSRARRARRSPQPRARLPPAAVFSASTGRSIDACAAGSSDTSMAVSSATPPVNTHRHRVQADHRRADARQARRRRRFSASPGATAERKNTSGSGMTAAAAASSAKATSSPRGRAERRQHHAFDEELPHDASAAGADRDADGDLAAPRHRPGGDEIRQVHARDQQHEADRAEQHQRRPADVGIDARRVHGAARAVHSRRAGVLRGMRGVDLTAEDLDRATRPSCSDTSRLAARDDRSTSGTAPGSAARARRRRAAPRRRRCQSDRGNPAAARR